MARGGSAVTGSNAATGGSTSTGGSTGDATATGADTTSTGACSHARHSRPHASGTHSGLPEYRRHSVAALVEHGRPSEVRDSSNRKPGPDRSGHSDPSGFRPSEPAEESRVRPNESVWRNLGRSGFRVSLPHEVVGG